MKNLLHFTINVRKSHRQPQCTLQLGCEYRVLFVRVENHVSLCWQEGLGHQDDGQKLEFNKYTQRNTLY